MQQDDETGTHKVIERTSNVFPVYIGTFIFNNPVSQWGCTRLLPLCHSPMSTPACLFSSSCRKFRRQLHLQQTATPPPRALQARVLRLDPAGCAPLRAEAGVQTPRSGQRIPYLHLESGRHGSRADYVHVSSASRESAASWMRREKNEGRGF